MVFTLEIKHRKIPIVIIARHGMLKGKFLLEITEFFLIEVSLFDDDKLESNLLPLI